MISVCETYRDRFTRGDSFDESDAESVLDALIESNDEAMLASLFEAWNEKGIEEHEIYSFAKIMRKRCIRVNSRHDGIVDIVGTGGSKVKTFNVSTAAAFVVAGAGVPVAKHGNKAATSSSGSADALSELGINHDVGPQVAEKCLNAIGICFMFAPSHHRLSPTLSKVRSGLGFPTIFNCVGPLCNPANAQHQLIGVWDLDLVPKMAAALTKLGTTKSWIVHGENGLDEISIDGNTMVAEVNDGNVTEFTIEPSHFGVDPIDVEVDRATSPKDSALIIKQVLSSDPNGCAARDLVLMNAAAAIYVSGRSDDLKDAFEIARASVMSGKAMQKLESYVNFGGQ
jgi:anthranilate phosphoribosyltransferase